MIIMYQLNYNRFFYHYLNFLQFNIKQIKSLKEIRDNKNYKYLRRLYASDNLIESIADLNGSALLQNYPRTIDLRYNKLKKVNSKNVSQFQE